tara:strand:- start:2260 stop:2655 length:396 start_codon:yes stop_codon:yes gene_type:complete
MGVLTGSDGQLKFNGSSVGKCREWSLSVSKDALEDTSIGSYDRTYVEGLRGTTGSATVLYDPANRVAAALLNSVFDNDKTSDSVDFVLNRQEGTSISCSAFVTSVSPSVSVGAVQAVSISFQINGKPDGNF